MALGPSISVDPKRLSKVHVPFVPDTFWLPHATVCSFSILAALCAMITVSEIWLHTLVFQSSWNLFHNW
jgi:hypothetical protein